MCLSGYTTLLIYYQRRTHPDGKGKSLQKLAYEFVDKMLEKCSKKEIDFIFYCCQFQNELGNVRGINYRFTCLNIHVSKQGFYKMLKSLESKELIIINWFNTEKDWSFTFVNNQFLNYRDFRKGYLKTNFFFLHELDFMNLKVKAKKLIIKLLKVYRPDKPFRISREKLQEWAGVKSQEELEPFIDTLRKYFNITDFKGMLTIKLKQYNQRYTDSDLYKSLYHKITTFCSKYRISYTMAAVRELYFIFEDYKDKYNKVVAALCDTVFRQRYDGVYKVRSIEPALIKSLITR